MASLEAPIENQEDINRYRERARKLFDEKYTEQIGMLFDELSQEVRESLLDQMERAFSRIEMREAEKGRFKNSIISQAKKAAGWI